ncbi:MAG: hypothetical protein HZB23_12370 [Deltaproteobacteria bacterium]|nr:hypothetical protein [Deltaproteobacteria bacterium]
MKKLASVLMGVVLAIAVTACGKPEVKEEKAEAPKPEVANPYAVQVKVMEKAKDLKAESEKKLAEQMAREAALAREEAGQ